MRWYVKSFILFLLSTSFTLSFTSCSSSRVLNSFEDAKFLENESVEIHISTGKIFETDNMFIKKDSTRILDKLSGNFISIPSGDIKFIKDVHHTLGAFEWLALGAALGFTYGMVWGKIYIENSHSIIGPRVRYGTIGALIGILPGAIIGHKFYYFIPNSSRDSIRIKP